MRIGELSLYKKNNLVMPLSCSPSPSHSPSLPPPLSQTLYLQDKSKLGVVLDFLVSNLDILSLLDREPTQQWIEDRIYTFSNVLQKETVSISYCSLNRVKVPKQVFVTIA